MMLAPCAVIAKACARAASNELNCPPSENESGVVFKIPMTKGMEIN
jgi:hypothetical protein